MSDRKLTPRGVRGLQKWLRTCKELGWSWDAMSRLHDLWMEYHDDDGNLVTPDGDGVSHE